MVSSQTSWEEQISNWDYHFDEIRKDDDLDPAKIEEVLMGFGEIRRIFGEKWIENAVKTKHPLLHYFINLAPWTRYWLADFGKKLAVLESVPNFDTLKQRLLVKLILKILNFYDKAGLIHSAIVSDNLLAIS